MAESNGQQTTGGVGAHEVKKRFDESSTVPLFINGKEVVTEKTFDVVSPLDGKVKYKCSAAGEKEVDAIVAAAEKAFVSWSKTKPTVRRDILLKLAQLMREQDADAKYYGNLETGQPEAMFGFEYNLGVEGCLTTAGLIGAVQGTVPTTMVEGRSAMLLREPYGVILGIAPWNAPHVLGMRACIGPLAMGNTVILKCPETAPATYWNFVRLIHEAGLPPGVLNTIVHDPADASKITSLLINNAAVRKVNFTGSTNVGSIIASQCGKALKPCLMELGGKAPSIVCADADLDNTALQCALGAFLHAGQICMATERIIVESTVAEEFKKKLSATIDQVFSSNQPAPVLFKTLPVKKNRQLMEDAVSKGAKTVYGDVNAKDDSEYRMRPIVIENVREDMDIYYTESFGPTVSLYEIPSGKDFEREALKLANDTEYGLASAVFTEDLRKALRLAKGIETGAVHINSMSVHDEAGLPHGGAKKSGFGRFNGQAGLEEWVRSKTITWAD